MEKITDKLGFIKTKNFCSVNDYVKRKRRQAQTGRKYLQTTPLIKDCYPKYTKNFKTQQKENKQPSEKLGKRREQIPHQSR